MSELDIEMLVIVTISVLFCVISVFVVISVIEGYESEVNTVKQMNCDELFNYLVENIDGGSYLGKTNEIAQKSFDLKCKSYIQKQMDSQNEM